MLTAIGNQLRRLANRIAPDRPLENALTEDSPVAGDLGGTYRAPRVERLHGNALASRPPQEGQVLTWVGGQWVPTTPASTSILAGTLKLETERGHKIEISDTEDGIAFSDSYGNRLVLGKAGIQLESASDVMIKAQGKISIEAVLNVSIDASTSVTVTGSSGATLSSSAVTAVQGSLVQIN